MRLFEGDLVLARNGVLSSKVRQFAAQLSPKFTGPYRISRVLSPDVYEISDLTHKYIGKSHLQDLEPYISNNAELWLFKVTTHYQAYSLSDDRGHVDH